MANWSDIRYGEFWDQPRIFYTLSQDRAFLFDCPFDEKLDDYPSKYSVYLLPSVNTAELEKSWPDPKRDSLRLIGTVELTQSAFDPTHRKQVDLDVIRHLIPAQDASPDGA